MTELQLTARELRAGDRIVGVKHGKYPRESHTNWVVAAPYGQIQPSGSWGIAMRKPNPQSRYELNLWQGTDWKDDTTFFVVR